MKLDAFCEWRHFVDHAWPVWAALPEAVKGTFYAAREAIRWHPNLGLVEGLPDRRSTDPVLVAGFGDAHTVRPRPVFLLNHGAGQSYLKSKGSESFSGGPGRERVLLHLEPGPLAARASEAAGHRYAEVGMPCLDPYHLARPIPTAGLVAVALHHAGRGAPEQMNAYSVFADAFAKLAANVDVVGHGHPRGWDRTANRWTQMGVRAEPDFARVLDSAALLVTDISSAGPMFASTGRPVVWISAPWHLSAPRSGGRFHDWTETVEAVGGHVTDPHDLVDVVRQHLARPQPLVQAQQAIVADCFAFTDGLASQRAAAEIVRVLRTVEADMPAPAAP